MKLEKFNKNKKHKKIIIASVIGILVIIGSIILYRTYAYYEEKKTFNVLQGKIPEFAKNDITLALKVNGTETQEIPSKGSGYYTVEVECDKGATGSWNYDTWGIEVTNMGNTKINCSLNFIDAINLSGNVNIGDYVSYTPSSTSYKIPLSLTGYTSDQTINPSELNLWRVIRKNDDGTIDMVSEYVSSTTVYFNGVIGYANFVGTLNTIAQQYTNSSYTISARHMGYSNQTENLSSFDPYTAPATASTSASTTTEEEAKGAGDMGYETDTNLVKTAVGDLIGYNVSSTSTARVYWLASRRFNYTNSTVWYFGGRFVVASGSVNGGYYIMAKYKSGSVSEDVNGSYAYAVRPIVTLKSGLSATGSGTSSSPYVLN